MKFTILVMKGAAEGNTLHVLEFLHAQGCRWHWSASAAAARRGELQMLRWIREHGCNWNEQSILSEAASSGNIETAAWVKQQPGVVCDDRAMIAAAARGSTATCEYLHAEQCPWSAQACDEAAINGHVQTLRWWHKHGCPLSTIRTCIKAAEGGSVSVLIFLQQQQGTVFATVRTYMLRYAGAHNKLAAAQWLRQQGAEWPVRLSTSRGATWSGEVLAWSRAEACTSPTQ
jgi:hypothetical protein